ncbi:MAG: DUF2142 domain-containing protein [Oscillospiraceae bacterium]|nr:DUF2142 domain-containing protein [Oscillospiraceae bacterium]
MMFKKREISFLVVLFILLCGIVFFSVKTINANEVITEDYVSHQSPTTGITKDVVVSQDICASENGLMSISLSFGTYRRINNSTVYIVITDTESSEEIFNGSLDASELSDGGTEEFAFSPIKDSRKRNYTVTVYSDADDANSVALWTNTSARASQININGVQSAGNLAYIAKYRPFAEGQGTTVFIALSVLIVASIVLMAIGVLRRDNKYLKNIMLCSASLIAAGTITESVYIKWIGSADFIHGIIAQPAVFFESAIAVFAAVYIMLGLNNDAFVSVMNSALSALKKCAVILYIVIVYLSAFFMVVKEKEGCSLQFKWLSCFIVGIVLFMLYLYYNTKFKTVLKEHISAGINSLKQLKKQSFIKFFIRISSYIITAGTVIMLPAAFWFYSDSAIVAVFVFAIVLVVFRMADLVVNDGKNIDYAKLFLMCSLITGFVFAFSGPLSSRITFDDQIHYSSAVKAAYLVTGKEITEADLFIGSTAMGTPDTITERAVVFDKMIEMGHNKLPYTDTGSIKLSTYSYLGYIPVIVCIILQRIFDIPYYIFIIMSRFSNVIVYSVVLYLGIKRLRSGQLIFAAIALIPENVLIAANYSYDFWVNAFIGYGMAYFISICQEKTEKITVSDMIKIAAAFFIGCGPKAIYFVLILPFVFLHKSKYRSLSEQKLFILLCGITAAIVAFTFVAPFLSDSGGSSDLRGGEGINSSEQLRYILSEPISYLKTLVVFLGEYMSLYYAGLNVASYAYLGNAEAWASSVILMIIIFTVFTDKNEYDCFENNGVIRLMFSITSLGAIVLACTALYISFTPVGHAWINGMQWRYQVPALFGLAYSLGSCRTRCGTGKEINALLVFGGIFATTFFSYNNAYISIIAGTQ